MDIKEGDTFNSHLEFESAFDEFLLRNDINLSRIQCSKIGSYYKKQGCDPEFLKQIEHLKFKRIVYACPSKRTRVYVNPPIYGGVCNAQVIIIADKVLKKLRIQRLNIYHIRGCQYAPQREREKDTSTSIKVTNIQTMENNKRKLSDDWTFNDQDFLDSSGPEDGESYSQFTNTSNDEDSLLNSPPTFLNAGTSQTKKLKHTNITPRPEVYKQNQHSQMFHKGSHSSQVDESISQTRACPKAHVVTETAGPSQMPLPQSSGIQVTQRAQAPPQTPDSADTLFFSSLCAQVQALPRSVKNHLKIKFLEMVNNALDCQL